MTVADTVRAGGLAAASAIRFVNPYQRDRPPPNPPLSKGTRRLLGGIGALAAVLVATFVVVIVRPEIIREALTFTFFSYLYAAIALIAVVVGTLAGPALEDRAPYKVVLGTFFGVPAAMVVFCLLVAAARVLFPEL